MKTPHVVVIGAGIGGLTAGALLLKRGMRVTVLEAQNYAGGCAGTFYYQGYRFDAGATLAGGFAEGGPHYRVAELLGLKWPIRPVESIAWIVHLPDGRAVAQPVSADAWHEERLKAFPQAEKFWQTQELLADLAWDVASRPFPWPPSSWRDVVSLGKAIRPKTILATPYLLQTIGNLLPRRDHALGTFVNANLLISAQTTADQANALYGSAALDLPRRGVNHVNGGMGGLAETLVDWIRANGGEVLYKQQVDQIEVKHGRAIAVHTNRQSTRASRSQLTIPCDSLIANLTPWGLNNLLGENASPTLKKEVSVREPTWGAFMIYAGISAELLPDLAANHHQIIRDGSQPLGETNSIFISISDSADTTRAPVGMRAVNISTHTDTNAWWQLRNDPNGKGAYEERRALYVEKMLDSAEKAIPNFRSAIQFSLPATPITYQQWTGRPQGMVGGFPQKSILQARGPQTGIPNLWLVGDSVFPGQSTAGVTLSGLRVAASLLK